MTISFAPGYDRLPDAASISRWVSDPDDDVSAPLGAGCGGSRFSSDVGVRAGGVDHLSVADVDADVRDVGAADTEEDEVSGLEGVVGSEARLVSRCLVRTRHWLWSAVLNTHRDT
jgi:hypothetical protein